jgi:hypothetical protein
MQFLVASSVAPGTYSVSFTASYGSDSHSAAVNVVVSKPAAPAVSNDAFISTSLDPNPTYGMVAYDKVHDLVFFAHTQLGEVDVASAKSQTILNRIHIPIPYSLDLSLDQSTLYVGTGSQSIYEIDTATQQIVGQVTMPMNPGGTTGDMVQPESVASLADGTLMVLVGCGYVNACSTGTFITVYNPATGTFTQPALADALTGEFAHAIASPDHQHVFRLGYGLARYDLATHSFVQNTSLGYPPYAIAISPDNTSVAALLAEFEVVTLDADLNIVNTYLDDLYHEGGIMYSADGSQLYLEQDNPSYPENFSIEVLDAKTLTLEGDLPGLQYGLVFTAMDGSNRLLGKDSYGVGFVDTGITPYPHQAQVPETDSGYAFSPDHPASGYATTLSGVYFTDTPLVTFNGVPATSSALENTNTISVTAPSSSTSALTDVGVWFPGGTALYIPQGYAYQPVIKFVDGDAGEENGGGSLTLYGVGFDDFNTEIAVTVGGRAAAVTTELVESFVTVTVPAGTPGNADITLTVPSGSATISGGYTYLQRTNATLPSGSAPFQVIQDSARNRLLWTDYAANTLVVYSTASGQIAQTIALGAEPAGLSLTPDGSKLLVVLFGSKQLEVFDASTLTLQQSAPAPGGYEPMFISAITGNKAFLLSTFNGYGSVPVYEYDIASNTFQQRNDVSFGSVDQSAVEAVSADGNTACVGGNIWTAETDSFVYPLDIRGTGSENGAVALAFSADGSVLANFRGQLSREGAFYDRSGILTGVFAQEDAIEQDLVFNAISAIKLNSTGSLAYVPEVDRIRIYDVRHGNAVKTIMVPDKLSTAPFDGVVVDSDGQSLYVMTTSGLATFTLGAKILSVGEVLTSNGQLTLLGSGFAPGAVVLIDGVSLSTTVPDSQHIVAALPTLAAGAHTVTVNLLDGTSYSIENALNGSSPTPYVIGAGDRAKSRVGIASPNRQISHANPLRERLIRRKKPTV